MALTAKTCTPCRGGVPPLTPSEAETLLAQTPGWKLRENATRLDRAFDFPDFRSAMNFAVQVGEVCEEEGHHADIAFGWGWCRVTLYTHKINGLHENDFIVAAKVNLLP